METLNLKRPGQEKGSFKFFKNNKGQYETQPESKVQKPQLPISKIPKQNRFIVQNYSFIENFPKTSSFDCFSSAISDVLSKFKEIQPIASKNPGNSINKKYFEIDAKIKEIQKAKNDVLMDLESENQKLLEKEAYLLAEILKTNTKIVENKVEKSKIEEKNRKRQKILKFFKDFSGLEILQIVENTLHIKVKHENSFFEFIITEKGMNYDYHLIKTSISIVSLSEMFTEDITFEKAQFRLFYLEMLDVLFAAG